MVKTSKKEKSKKSGTTTGSNGKMLRTVLALNVLFQLNNSLKVENRRKVKKNKTMKRKMKIKRKSKGIIGISGSGKKKDVK